MKLANPASWITTAYLKRQAENPELTDAQVLQLHGCVWAATSSTWIAPDAWANCATARTLEDGEEVVLAFDGSYRRDATALAACTLDGFVSVVIWERPERAPADWKVPREEVSDAIAEAMKKFDVRELACDPPGWHAEIEGWREQYGSVVVDFPTSERRRMAAACDRFRVAALEGDLTHDGDPALARHCVANETPFGTIVGKEHPDSPRKIDAAVAAVVAFERAAWHQSRTSDLPLVVFT
jgi:phage terminase large subunit-like protein